MEKEQLQVYKQTILQFSRVVMLLFLASIAAGIPSLAQKAPEDRTSIVPRDTLERWMAKLSNAGRWGPQDELGTLNLITPEKRIRAAHEVRDGITVSLAHEMVAGPDENAPEPFKWRYDIDTSNAIMQWTGDQITLYYHGWSYSHIDALSHLLYRYQMYNGYGMKDLTSTGAQRLGIHAMHAGIVTRGVVVDIPRLKGLPYLELGTPITVQDLEQWEKAFGVRIEQGDVLLIRTGRWARAKALGTWVIIQGTAGPHPSIAAWLKARGVAALGSDVTNEFYPSVVPEVPDPLHALTIVTLGMPLFDNLDLEELGNEAQARSRWTFLFVAAPLRIRGASGSSLNPLALF